MKSGYSSFATVAAAALIASATLAGSAFAQTPAPAKKPVTAPAAARPAGAGEVAIPTEQLDLILKERLAQGQPDSPELRATLRDELINRELFMRAAKASSNGCCRNACAAASLVAYTAKLDSGVGKT